MRLFLYLGIGSLLILGVSFACVNATPIDLNLFLGTFRVSLPVLLVIVLSLGMILGACLPLSKYMRLKIENRKLKKKIFQS